jgi:hypothetical protein
VPTVNVVGMRVKSLASLKSAQNWPVPLGCIGEVKSLYSVATTMQCSLASSSYNGVISVKWEGMLDAPYIHATMQNIAVFCEK